MVTREIERLNNLVENKNKELIGKSSESDNNSRLIKIINDQLRKIANDHKQQRFELFG